MERKRSIGSVLLLILLVGHFSCRSTQQKSVEYAYYWSSGNNSADRNKIYQINTSTEEEKQTASLPGQDGTAWVSLSPYRPILVSATESDQEKRIWWSLPDADWQVIETAPVDSYFQSPYWMPDANGILYLKALEETQQGEYIQYASYELMQYLFSEKNPRRIGSFQSPVSSVAWSPDHTKVAFFARSDQEAAIWVYDVTTQALTSLCPVEADHYSKNRIHWVDNQTFIWLEVQSLFSWNLLEKKKTTVITLPEVILGFDFFLPDSTLCLTYSLSEPSDKSVCVLYSWKNKKSQIIASGYQIDSPRFSPDGSKILFFYRPSVSEKPDLIIFTIPTQKKTKVCSVGKISIYPWNANPTYAIWSSDSQQILVENKQENDSIVQLYTLSPVKLLKNIIQTDFIYTYRFSPSDEWIKVEYPQEEQTKITLVHWKSGKTIDIIGEWLGWSAEDVS